MGAFSFWHLAIVAVVIIVLFGKGRLSTLMGDAGKGIGTFRRELLGARRGAEDTELLIKDGKPRRE
ncbi:twin-arginine translocase TatA/TatE family subunit [Mesorhizobium sp. M0207]|uniref:twin-arginine translocase TatA/TatE family subunit n=1 Tax=Mesorhizobium sp. M0207 TaxID=2956915 RepID=UPI003335386D